VIDIETKAAFKEWVVLELMGHRRLAGLLTEQEIAGHGFLRLDIHGPIRYKPTGEAIDEKIATQFYSPSSVYAITPTSEATARAFAERNQPAPISRWDLPLLSAPTVEPPEEAEREREEDPPF
jgi:hypothetical protein